MNRDRFNEYLPLLERLYLFKDAINLSWALGIRLNLKHVRYLERYYTKVETSDVYQIWMLDGKLHRRGAPAVIYPNAVTYFIWGVETRDGGPSSISLLGNTNRVSKMRYRHGETRLDIRYCCGQINEIDFSHRKILFQFYHDSNVLCLIKRYSSNLDVGQPHVIEYSKEGYKKSEHFDNRDELQTRWYFPNGNVKEDIYKGKRVCFYKNGTVSNVISAEHHLKYDINGNLRQEVSKDMCRVYYKNGSIKYIEYLKNGLDSWVERVKKIGYYPNGALRYMCWYNHGRPCRESPYLPVRVHYRKNGQVRSKAFIYIKTWEERY